MALPKQDPAAKASRVAAADGKVYFSYASIHTAVSSLVPRCREFRCAVRCRPLLLPTNCCRQQRAVSQPHPSLPACRRPAAYPTGLSVRAAVSFHRPDVIVAIGGGGFIPARMLRTELKVPILAVSLELYDDTTNTINGSVKRIQWFDETSGAGRELVQGKRVLIMDEVDDTRTTLKFCVEELLRTSQPAAVVNAYCV
jgi:adenine/guanine phosphoribosyltransferase-like PRPP-binding protein